MLFETLKKKQAALKNLADSQRKVKHLRLQDSLAKPKRIFSKMRDIFLNQQQRLLNIHVKNNLRKPKIQKKAHDNIGDRTSYDNIWIWNW